jgi:hypothetical protein
VKNQAANSEIVVRTVGAAPPWGVGTLKKVAATALLGLATLSSANAQVPDCAPGKLSDYEKLGAQGCLIGDKKFSNFHYRQGASGVPSYAISLTPGITIETDDAGLLLEAKWASASKDSFVSYNVEALPNGEPIKGASLQMQFAEITGTGKAMVLADLCSSDGTTDSCGPQKLELKVVLSAGGPKTPADNNQFQEPQRAIRVVNPIHVTSGTGGSAKLDSFMTVFR